MKIDLNEFEEYLKKATMNFLFDYVCIEIEKDKVSTYLNTIRRDVISVVSLENTFLKDMDEDSYEWNFDEPNQHIIPIINLFENREEVDCEIKDGNKIIFIQKSKESKKSLKTTINLSIQQKNKLFLQKTSKGNLNYFHTHKIDEDFVSAYEKVKRVSARLGGKVYFTIKDDKLYLEAGDKVNSLSNVISVELCDVDLSSFPKKEDKKGKEISPSFFFCYDFKTLSSLMSVLDLKQDKFTASYVFDLTKQIGMIYFKNTDESINYYICSKKDI